MATTAEKLREIRKDVSGNFEKILQKYYDEVYAHDVLGKLLPSFEGPMPPNLRQRMAPGRQNPAKQ